MGLVNKISPILLIIFFLCQTGKLLAQEDVGLVLSGGGAKGIAHIGVIKALEDNEIPIDYVTGTSMGAIIGGLYAIGYSPEDMLKLFESNDFYQSYSGDLSNVGMYGFRHKSVTPEVLDFTLSVKGVKQMAVGITGFALVDPTAMNLTFFELFAPASISAHNDFNRLFVPFRCIGSDIYKKKEVVLDKGSLARALQISMSIPFYFRPLENEDKKILIDGGVYNNLPIEPMKNAFHPDYLIASTVINSDKPKIINDDIGEFFVNMILQKTDSLASSDKGLIIDVIIDEVGMMEFEKVQEAYQIGYKKGLEMVDSIRQHVSTRRSAEEVREARDKYKENIPEITFENILIKGVDDNLQQYFESFFWKNKQKPYTIKDFKQDYLNLLAGSINMEIVPSILYDDQAGTYQLSLHIKTLNSPQIAIGGNISSLNANQLYIGLRLNRFPKYPVNYNMDLFWGNTLNSVALTSQLEAGGKLPMRYELKAAFNYYRYSEPNQVFFEYSAPLYNQKEYFAKIKAATPFYSGSKVELALGLAQLEDRYSSLETDIVEPAKKATYTVGQAKIGIYKSIFNNKLFPIQGEKYLLSAGYHPGRQTINQKNGNSYVKQDSEHFSYFSLAAATEKYVPLNSHFRFKYLFDSYFSNKPAFNDYQSTVIQAQTFAPTPHSLITFNPDLKANNYIALGLAPICKVTSNSHLRFENYLFLPIDPIINNNGKAAYGKAFSRNTYFSELSFVFNLPVLSVSLFGNYYSHANSHFNFGLNIGYLIFNERFQ